MYTRRERVRHAGIHVVLAVVTGMIVGCATDGTVKDGSTEHKAHWGYSGEIGPDHWADLDPEYALARSGKRQSPIDLALTDASSRSLPDPQLDYKPVAVSVFNNGHTIEVTCAEGNTLEVDGKTFGLAQFHFHGPSEHTVDGQHFDMEMHLVHKSADGEIAVIGVLMKSGSGNEAFEAIFDRLPRAQGEIVKLTELTGTEIDPKSLLPADLRHWQYDGSLTTPPCTEGVHWLVLTTPVDIAGPHANTFRKIIGVNNRPVQPLNEREVVQDSD